MKVFSQSQYRMNYLQYDNFNATAAENMKGHESQCRCYLHEYPDKCKEGRAAYLPGCTPTTL